MSTQSAAATVGKRFAALVSEIQLTQSQKDDGSTKHQGVRTCLNQWYWNSSSNSANSRLVGSWGKSTAIRPPRDVDVLFQLPYAVYERFEKYTGNKQSALLQEVKNVLLKTYPSTKMRADGQVVVVGFGSYGVEVLPSVLLTSGKYWICDTNNGGRYKVVDPDAEATQIQNSNSLTNGNTRNLIRMMKCWQGVCNVWSLKSFWIELLVTEFLGTYQYADKGTVYYDWMVRDFFRFLWNRANGFAFVPGTGEVINLGDDWKSRVESAYSRAVKAIEYEEGGYPYLAGEEWQKIFGSFMPSA
jgi:hypothetical protein